jgi:hypothetical protein
MAIGSNILEGKPSEWALLKRHPDEDIFGVQIASGYADQFARTCELLEAETTVDFVDLNLGCPLDLVCNKGAGAALMLRDKRLKECLEEITSALSCPFTIKIRTGWDESKPVAHQLIPKVQKWGIDGLSAVMVCYIIFILSRLQASTFLFCIEFVSHLLVKMCDAPYIDLLLDSRTVTPTEVFEASKLGLYSTGS